MYITRKKDDGSVELLKIITERNGTIRATDVLRNQFSFSADQIVERFEESSVFETVYQGIMIKF